MENCYYQAQQRVLKHDAQKPNCAPPVPYACQWDAAAKQHVCTDPQGQRQYYACQNGAYGIYNYGATYTPVGPFYK